MHFCIRDEIRRRRINIRDGAKGTIDMSAIDFTGSPVHQERLFGDGVINTIAAARKDQSNVQYSNYIARYEAWAKRQGVSVPFNCDINVPLNFLQYMMDEAFVSNDLSRRRSYSVMRIIVSSLSTVLFYEGVIGPLPVFNHT